MNDDHVFVHLLDIIVLDQFMDGMWHCHFVFLATLVDYVVWPFVGTQYC